MSTIHHRSFPKGLDGKYAKVDHRLPPGCSVLEIGCHTGYFSRVLMERGYQVLGIEIDDEAARVAKHAGVPVICGNVEDSSSILPINKTFDVILLMDVIEHLRNPLDVLKGLKSALDTHGRLIITGPNVAYWAVRKDLLLGRWNYVDAGILDRSYLRFYTASTWHGNPSFEKRATKFGCSSRLRV